MATTKKFPEDPRQWPWGTLAALFTTLVLGVTSLVAPDQLSFNDYYTQVTIVWGALAVGRGLAAKHDPVYYEEYGPITRFMNSFSWATVGVGFFAVVGYVLVLTHGGDGSMGYDELAAKVGALVGALGVGRGLAVLKKDTTIGSMPVTVNQLVDPGVTITDENLHALSKAVGIADAHIDDSPVDSDEDMGAVDEPQPDIVNPEATRRRLADEKTDK
jgi:hypothetical protein